MQPMNRLFVSCLVLIYLVTLFYVYPISIYFLNVCFCISILASIHMPLSSVVIITIITFLLVSQFELSPFFKPSLHCHQNDLSRIQIRSLITSLWLKSSVTLLSSRWNLSPSLCYTRSSSWFSPFLTFKGYSCYSPKFWLMPHIFLNF